MLNLRYNSVFATIKLRHLIFEALHSELLPPRNPFFYIWAIVDFDISFQQCTHFAREGGMKVEREKSERARERDLRERDRQREREREGEGEREKRERGREGGSEREREIQGREREI